MSNVLTHRFVSPKLDGGDATQVQPSAWNDGHTFTGGAAGDVLTRDPTDAVFGASWAAPAGWTAYSPQWWVNSVLQTLGTHQLNGAYYRRGNAVWIQIQFTQGATAIGGGDWTFGLPFPNAGTVLAPGPGVLFLPGVAYIPLWALARGYTDRVQLAYLATGSYLSLSALTATAPLTLTAGTFIELRGSYQAV